MNKYKIVLHKSAAKKLSGELAGFRRFRVGDFRIVYDIMGNDKIIVVHAIGSRGDIYK